MNKMLKDTVIAICFLASAIGFATGVQIANAGCNNEYCSGGTTPCASVIGPAACGVETCTSGTFVCWWCTCSAGLFTVGRPDCVCT